jgi:hypothetical protein
MMAFAEKRRQVGGDGVAEVLQLLGIVGFDAPQVGAEITQFERT